MKAGRARMEINPGRRRRGRGRTSRRLLVGAAALLAVYYLGRGENGRARRRRLRESSGSGLRHAGRRFGRLARHLGSEAFGAYQRLAHPAPGPAGDDLTLLDRVESELFADPGIPKGRINLEVERGTVILRGQLDSDEEMKRIVKATGRIPGVKAVHSYLHLPETPAPNKADAIRASTVAEWREGS